MTLSNKINPLILAQRHWTSDTKYTYIQYYTHIHTQTKTQDLLTHPRSHKTPVSKRWMSCRGWMWDFINSWGLFTNRKNTFHWVSDQSLSWTKEHTLMQAVIIDLNHRQWHIHNVQKTNAHKLKPANHKVFLPLQILIYPTIVLLNPFLCSWIQFNMKNKCHSSQVQCGPDANVPVFSLSSLLISHCTAFLLLFISYFFSFHGIFAYTFSCVLYIYCKFKNRINWMNKELWWIWMNDKKKSISLKSAISHQ